MSGFDYYTIIGRDPSLFQGHVENTLRNAGLPRDLWDFNVIVYHNRLSNAQPFSNATDEILDICHEYDINYTLHYEHPDKPFIERLYDCWNLGYTLGQRPLVFRGGSDQTWSKDAFANLWNAWESLPFSDAILQAQTVEHMVSHPGSRHFCRDFGTDFESYNEEAFFEFCGEISRPGAHTIQECLEIWGKPTRMINGPPRTNGS